LVTEWTAVSPRRQLGGVLETFSEGHDTADLRAVREQMAQLSRADSSKRPSTSSGDI
jgi:hypothetical protein